MGQTLALEPDIRPLFMFKIRCFVETTSIARIGHPHLLIADIRIPVRMSIQCELV